MDAPNRIADMPTGQSADVLPTTRQGVSPESANLDLLRSVAVLAVFGCHLWSSRTGEGAKWDIAWHFGRLGVEMFFVHTSLVLMWSTDRLKLQGSRLFTAFYTRRAFRIYPLSIFCVLVAFYFSRVWTHADLWANLTLTQNLFNHRSIYVPLWTLPLEVQMYLVLPALFLILRDRPVLWTAAVWLLSVPIAAVQPWLGDRFLVLAYAPCFLAGVLAWRIMRSYDIARFPGWLWPVALVPISAIWMVSSSRYVAYELSAFALCLGLGTTLFREIPWTSVRKASQLVAKYSYGIYLSHFMIIAFAFGTLAGYRRMVQWSVLLSLSVVIPVLLYHLIEDPGIRLGHKLARRLVRRPVQVRLSSIAEHDVASSAIAS
jgi:peptidoglycan/LPS O-acetylase OafA/YrhL